MDAPVVAWHGRQALKDETVARMREHRRKDEFHRGAGFYQIGADGVQRGCFHGCLTTEVVAEERGVHPFQAADYLMFTYYDEAERLFGIPAPLGYLLDDLFEGVPESHAPWFAVEVLQVMPVGADLSLVPMHAVHRLLVDAEDWGVTRVKAVTPVRQLYSRLLDGDQPTVAQWHYAEDVADAARSEMKPVSVPFLAASVAYLAAAANTTTGYRHRELLTTTVARYVDLSMVVSRRSSPEVYAGVADGLMDFIGTAPRRLELELAG